MDGGREGPTDLVTRIAQGDRRAEEALVLRYARGVRFLLAQRADGRAFDDDLFQDTFMLVLVKIRNGEVREPEKLGGFIQAIARNLLVEHFRKETRRRTDCDAEMIERVAAEAPSPFAAIERDELRRRLHEAIDGLGQERDRKLLRRYFFDGVDKSQLCRELDADSAHFDRLKYRALKRLANCFREDPVS